MGDGHPFKKRAFEGRMPSIDEAQQRACGALQNRPVAWVSQEGCHRPCSDPFRAVMPVAQKLRAATGGQRRADAGPASDAA
jgi:hypothetical protein